MNHRDMLIGGGLSPILVPLLAHQSGAEEKKAEGDKIVDYLFVQTAKGGSIQREIKNHSDTNKEE